MEFTTPILFNRPMRVLFVALFGRGSGVQVDASRLRVGMGWHFRLDAPRSAIASVEEDNDRVVDWGVHGWRGRWTVNGSSKGLVRITFDPPQPAKVLRIVPITLRVLRVSVVDRDGLLAALGAGAKTIETNP